MTETMVDTRMWTPPAGSIIQAISIPGWGTWPREEASPLTVNSDGYAVGVVVDDDQQGTATLNRRPRCFAVFTFANSGEPTRLYADEWDVVTFEGESMVSRAEADKALVDFGVKVGKGLLELQQEMDWCEVYDDRVRRWADVNVPDFARDPFLAAALPMRKVEAHVSCVEVPYVAAISHSKAVDGDVMQVSGSVVWYCNESFEADDVDGLREAIEERVADYLDSSEIDSNLGGIGSCLVEEYEYDTSEMTIDSDNDDL